MEDNRTVKVTVVEHRGSGGMIHYAYQLCTAMAKQGAMVTLITSLDYELDTFPHNFHVKKLMRLWPQVDPLLSKTPRNKIETLWRKIFWNVRRGFRAIRLIIEWARLTKYLIKTQPDIIQFGELENAVERFFIRHMQRKGLVLSQICHEFEKREINNGNSSPLTNARLNAGIYEAFSAIFVHDQANQDRFLSLYDIPAERIHSIRHGNEQVFPKSPNPGLTTDNLRRKYKLTTSDQMILFFGNLTPSKGIPDLIQAFKHVHAFNKNTKLIIAGMPSKYIDMNALEQSVNDLELNNLVFFDNRYIPMDEIGSLMELANVVVYPYRNITQSGALQVAYAFGKPVVTTNAGGFPEAVDDGKSGFLVPVESPMELAKAIIRIVENPELAKEMGVYAKHLSETRFAWEPIAAKIVSVYRDLIWGEK
jgi:glycosyltransferase involved in cell wall biosynthesis